ncbi:AAA family ATPase [Bradyrhizobium japonicum]|uniref:AAA family ATPase n=1 Tax=Bradyrhizobium japonicum TaxID=375 RepID=UPI001BA9ECB9|nr:AAA family ATPase [Bradyrhizobium japonicum]MBR0913868.1 AAA family ATPase [Bradyrhizobium japonicum]
MSEGETSVMNSENEAAADGGYMDEELQEAPAEPEARFGRVEASRCLADAALEAALAPEVAARLGGAEQIALTVRVPSAEWVKPIGAAFRRLESQLEIIARDGSSRSGHKADAGNEEVGRHLSRGRSVVGIAHSVALLPRALIAAADAALEVKSDAAVVGIAIARHVGASPPDGPIEGLGSLDFNDLVSAFRPGSDATEIAERLRLAGKRMCSPRSDRLPRLSDAVEYGPARDWGLALGFDFSEWRAGRLAWRDVGGAGANAVFVGESGLGKTFFARVLAAHLGIPLIATSIAETFASSAGYLDSVIKAIRETFARAEASAPCALLWDEIDALPMRSALDGRSSSWWTPVVTEFLTLLDSAVSSERVGVCVWAATNYENRLDPALIRPGRLERIIRFAPPGPEGLVSVARHHLAGELAQADLSDVGRLGIGRGPAGIAAAVKEARRAARQAGRALVLDDLVEALAPRADVDPTTLARVCGHEAGHAVVALALEVDEIVAVDVIGTADSLGRTMMRGREAVETRATIEDRVTARLGGRAAEAVLFDGDCSANSGGGETSDLAMASRAISALHFSEGLGGGLVYLGDDEAAASMLRLDVRFRATVEADLARLHDRAVAILRRERRALEAIAAALADRRHLGADEIRRLFHANRSGTLRE